MATATKLTSENFKKVLDNIKNYSDWLAYCKIINVTSEQAEEIWDEYVKSRKEPQEEKEAEKKETEHTEKKESHPVHLATHDTDQINIEVPFENQLEQDQEYKEKYQAIEHTLKSDYEKQYGSSNTAIEEGLEVRALEEFEKQFPEKVEEYKAKELLTVYPSYELDPLYNNYQKEQQKSIEGKTQQLRTQLEQLVTNGKYQDQEKINNLREQIETIKKNESMRYKRHFAMRCPNKVAGTAEQKGYKESDPELKEIYEEMTKGEKKEHALETKESETKQEDQTKKTFQQIQQALPVSPLSQKQFNEEEISSMEQFLINDWKEKHPGQEPPTERFQTNPEKPHERTFRQEAMRLLKMQNIQQEAPTKTVETPEELIHLRSPPQIPRQTAPESPPPEPGGRGLNLINRINRTVNTARNTARLAQSFGRGAVQLGAKAAPLLANPYVLAAIAIVIGIILLIVIIVAIINLINQQQNTTNVSYQSVPGLKLAVQGPTHINNPSTGNTTTIVYTILANYSGTDSIVITDQLPTNSTTFISSNPPGKYNGNTITWTLKDLTPSGSTNGGQDYTITITLQPTIQNINVVNTVYAEPAQ